MLPSIWLLALLTFASGCAALVFQVAWMRELRLVFGATTAAVAAVLAIFMAGIGIGSAVLGKRADRVDNPLRMYGVLEAAIALSAAVTPWLVDLASAIYIGLGGQESLGLTGATAIRLALAAAVMSVPTFLMGGTLPAAVRSVTRATDDHRRALGVLYGSNTLGAVFGAAVATFFALEFLGTRATLHAACALGLIAGLIAIRQSRGLAPLAGPEAAAKSGAPARSQAAMPSPDELPADPGFRPRLVYLTAAVLGFTFFALELVWYRMLGPILGGTAFTFGLILCVALFGIGVGGLAYNFVFRRLQPTWSALAVTCGCEALLTMIPYALGDRLALMAGWFSQAATSFSSLVLGWACVTSIVVLPVALVSGLQFPLLTALLGHGRQGVSRHLGMTYAWNTLGAIAGSLVAGFGGLPLLSAPGMWAAIAFLLALLSLVVLVGSPAINRRAVVVVAGLVLLTVAAMFSRGPTAAWRHGGIGAGRSNLPPRSYPNQVQLWLNETRRAAVWETDGIETSVAINGVDGLAFIVNGKSDGNSLNDAATQMGVSALAAVLHRDPKTALVIGLGTGESTGWLADMRNIERVDVVELEPAIDEMASRCSGLNRDVLNHPRVRRIYNDGREFVMTTKNKYDVIISEPSNPYRAGIAALYTTEFYQAVRRCLNDDGIFLQWMQAYEISGPTLGTVLATVGGQFEYVEVWQTMPVDLHLVCSNKPLDYTVDTLRERIASDTVREALAISWEVDDVEGFLAHYAAGPGWAREMQDLPLPRNTDDCTVLEYGFAKTVGLPTDLSIERTRVSRSEKDRQKQLQNDTSVDRTEVELRRQLFNVMYGGETTLQLLPDKEHQDLVMAWYHAASGANLEEFKKALDLWPAKYRKPKDEIQQLLLARCYAELAMPEALETIATAAESNPAEAAAFRAAYHARKKEWNESAQALHEFLSRLKVDPWIVPRVTEGVFRLLPQVAMVAPSTAAMLYEPLTKPFAAFRYNYQRQVARVLVAGQLGPEKVVEALAEMEPNVTWTAGVLELRAKSYAAVDHPLAARAQSDWEWFQKHRRDE